MSMIPHMIQTAAETTAYLAATIVLSGVVSGIVAVGIVQGFARERLQRSVLEKFFKRSRASAEERGSKATEPSVATDTSEGSSSETQCQGIADLMGLPEPTLCRLYYRQVAGQFLAAINSEATRSDSMDPATTPLLDVFAGSTGDRRVSAPTMESGRERLHEATRRVDGLQAQLGEAVSRPVMMGMLMVWIIFYLVVGAIAYSQLQLATGLSVGARLESVLEVVVPTFVIGLVAALLAVSAAACGMLVFAWLDRLVASR